mgnify:CR=1 FL=1
MNGIVRIPDTPGRLLQAAALLDRLRAATEARGASWPTLEEELAAREQLLDDERR